MKYTLSNIQKKKEGETNGKKWTIFEGEFNDGKTTVTASFFGELPEGEVEGTIEDGKYGKNFKQAQKGGGRSAQMERVMNKKAEQISVAQTNKNEGIKISSCNRMACDIVVAMMNAQEKPSLERKEIENTLKYWKAYFYVNWDDVDQGLVEPF